MVSGTPYFETGLVIVVREGSDVQGPSDLDGREVGVQEGTTGERWLRQNTSATVVAKPIIEEAFRALAQGEELAAVVHDDLSCVSALADYPNLRLLEGRVTQEQYGIAVRKGCPDLLQALNDGLAALMESGTYRQLCQKWEVEAGCVTAGAPAPVAVATPGPTEEPPSTPTESAGVPTPFPLPSEEAPPTPTRPGPRCAIPTVTSSEAGQPYQIQAGDWLSTIAGREYGNPLDYRAIVFYTNQKCQADAAYACIANPDQLRVGSTVYLPNPEEVSAYWEGLVNLPPLDFTLAGDIDTLGSSTVYLLTYDMAACFREGGFAGDVIVESIGTGEGFREFCVNGNADIVNASRPIKDEEVQACRAIGREPLAFRVGTDAISVVVSKQNEFAQDVTLNELRQILSTASMWSDVRQGWPAEPIRRFYPTPDSGTFAILQDIVFPEQEDALLGAANVIQQSENDEELVAGIQASPYAVGFFGYAYYERDQDRLRALPVDGVEPKPETVDLGTYPLIRSLFIYTTADVLQQKPQVAAFINFYLQRVKYYIVDVGYFLPSEDDFKETIQTYNDVVAQP